MLVQDRINQLRQRLLGAGYQPIAVRTFGKAPVDLNWQKTTGLPPYDKDLANTGVLCGTARGVDVDIDDPAAVSVIAAMIEAILGAAPTRVRSNSPRLLMVYRCAGEPRPKRVIQLPIGKVEILGLGQQFVGFGGHPSGVPYDWRGPSLDEVPIGELRAVSEEQEIALEAALRARWPGSGASEEETAAGRPNGADGPRSGSHNTCNPEDVEAALDALPNDYPREMWIKLGMAAHAGGASFEAFDRWSRKWSGYSAKDTAAAWKSFAKTRSVTEATLFDEVFWRLPGWKKPSEQGVAEPEADPAEKKRRTRSASSSKVQRADLLNTRRLLQRDEDLRGLVSYDAFSDEIILERPIPRPDYPSEKDWTPRPLQDEDTTALAEVLLSHKLLKASSPLVHEVVRGIAKDVSKHPVRDYLRALEWDGAERLSGWLKDYAGAICTDPDNDDPARAKDRTIYVEAVSRAALIGAVARVMRPGCKHDHVLTLIGPQGIGKSTLLRALVPNPAWFSDSLVRDLGDKDAMVGLAGCFIAEMAELASLNKTDFSMAKAFLSRQVDRFRPPYGRCDVKRPRQTAFFASTNQPECFRDETGNRRFWPVDCTVCTPGKLAKVRDQLWAEAVHFYDDGEKWWLNPDVEAIAQGEQARRMAVHPLVPAVQEAIGDQTVIEIKTVLETWESRKAEWGRLAPEVAKALQAMGWTKSQRIVDGTRAVRWYAPETGA